MQGSSVAFKELLCELKSSHEEILSSRKVSSLSVQETAILIYNHLFKYNSDLSPDSIRTLLQRIITTQQITWDHLLQFFVQEVSNQNTFHLDFHHQITAHQIFYEEHNSTFNKLIEYLKSKEINNIQNIYQFHLAGNANELLIVLQKEIVFYQLDEQKIISTMHFLYTNVAEKIRHNNKSDKNDKSSLKNRSSIEMLDTVYVEPIQRKKYQSQISFKNSQPPTFNQRMPSILSNHIKQSVRGSELSSEKEKKDSSSFKRSRTQSAEYKKKLSKSNAVKYRHDDIKKIFLFFQNSHIENSIHIANAVCDAQSNFNKYILLEKQWLQKEESGQNLEASETKFQKNFNLEVEKMKRTNKQLNPVSLIQKRQLHHLDQAEIKHKSVLKGQREENQYYKEKKQSLAKISPLESKKLQILHLTLVDSYILMSFFNREVRLYKIKKSLGRIKQELIFEKCYDELAPFVVLYKSTNTWSWNMVVCLQKANGLKVIICNLTSQMQTKDIVFSCDINYVPIMQALLPLGLVAFNEVGEFTLIELNNPITKHYQSKSIEKQLFNKQSNVRVSLSQVRVHPNLITFYFSCSAGYLYIFDKNSQNIKYQRKIAQVPIFDFLFLNQFQELACLLKNGSLLLCDAAQLEILFVFQSFQNVNSSAKLYTFQAHQHQILEFYKKQIKIYNISENQQKKFNLEKKFKIAQTKKNIVKSKYMNKYKNKEKIDKRLNVQKQLGSKSLQSGSRIKKKTIVSRVIEGQGGNSNYLILISENGEIIVYNEAFETVGIYHYLYISDIINIQCNSQFQFIAILHDNNCIDIINLYTSNLLFTIDSHNQNCTVPAKDKLSLNKNHRRSLKSTLISNIFSNRPIQKHSDSSLEHTHIIFSYFFEQNFEAEFFATITQNYVISHYNRGGQIIKCIHVNNLQLQVEKALCLVYHNEQIYLAGMNGSVTALHKMVYSRKYVLQVTSSKIISLKQINSKHSSMLDYQLYGMTEFREIFFINVHNKTVRIVSLFQNPLKFEDQIFNSFILLKKIHQKYSIYTIGQHNLCSLNEHNLCSLNEKDLSNYFVVIFSQKIVLVSKTQSIFKMYSFKGMLQKQQNL